jgi:hypothetical protein
MMTRKQDPIDWNLKSFLQNRYSTVPRNDLQKILDSILELVEFSRDRNHDLRDVLDQAARKMFRLFDFGEIAIGLKDPKDGLYRYETLFGFSKNTEAAYRQLKYTPEEMVSYDKYPFVKTGRISELDPAEGLLEEERHLYDRPLVAGAPRPSLEDFQEGDYFDVWMYDDSKRLIGWIELSRTKSGKMPSTDTLRWVEVFAEVCTLIVQKRLKG